MSRRPFPQLLMPTLAALALASPPAFAQEGYDPDTGSRTDGHFELRPIGAAYVPLNSFPAQTLALVGLDILAPLTRPMSLVFGAWFASGDEFRGANAHLGVKYRILDFHSVAIPYFTAGIAHSWGFPEGSNKDKRTITGLGFSAGLGMDFAILDRVRPGVQAQFDFGPKLLPNIGVFANVQILFGVTFVL